MYLNQHKFECGLADSGSQPFIYVCIIGLQFPQEIKDQRELAKRTSQIMKNGQGVIIQKGIWYLVHWKE